MVTAPSSHFRLEMVVFVPLSEKALGLRTPLELSAPTAVAMATGSKNASCWIPGTSVDLVTVRRLSRVFNSRGERLLHSVSKDDREL